MQQWWWAAVPLAVGAMGYLARRWIERRRRAEGLNRKLQALALHVGLRREGLTLDDLDQLERRAGD
jgi:hypothetical protein